MENKRKYIHSALVSASIGLFVSLIVCFLFLEGGLFWSLFPVWMFLGGGAVCLLFAFLKPIVYRKWLGDAKGGCLNIDDTTMDYVSFGTGSRNLIMIPGLGDGLKTVKGRAVAYYLLYKMCAKEYKVHVFSRKNKLSPGYSTKDMAHELKKAMEMLGIENADVVGVSQGGMISQHLAIEYPEMVNKLVLVVTVARPNDCIESVISRWMQLAMERNYRELMRDNVRVMYTKEFIRKNKWMMPILERVGAPASYDRFLIMAEACIKHNCYEELHRIQAPTLVIGGELDETVGAKGSKELAERISGSQLVMYPEYGHALYEEAKDFNRRVFDFLIS